MDSSDVIAKYPRDVDMPLRVVGTMADEGRTKATDFNICFAHQNERSGGFASGTIEFAVNPNAELGEHLNKNHKIQTRMNRSGKRLGVYRDIQETKGRAPQLKPKPAGETRWQGKLNITLLSP